MDLGLGTVHPTKGKQCIYCLAEITHTSYCPSCREKVDKGEISSHTLLRSWWENRVKDVRIFYG